jgi:predicted 3-demethylubiquinone-9 3-methyltransferase (glyoxalase superfamily)
MPAITPDLWFDSESEEAGRFYCSMVKIDAAAVWAAADGA